VEIKLCSLINSAYIAPPFSLALLLVNVTVVLSLTLIQDDASKQTAAPLRALLLVKLAMQLSSMVTPAAKTTKADPSFALNNTKFDYN